MVRRNGIFKLYKWLVVVTGLLLSSYGHASEQLQLAVSSKQVELGKAIQLTLSSPQMKVPLDSLDLSLLRAGFHLKESSEIQIANATQQRRVTLYPRKSGELIIPPLSFMQTTTAEEMITVTPPLDPKNNTPIEIKTSVSTLNPWKKQQVLVKLEFLTRDTIINFETPRAYADKSEVVSLKKNITPQASDKYSWSRHTTGWAVFPQQDGTQQLDLPAIRLVRDGVTTHRFYPPLIRLDVKKLPVYLPATIPVGKLALQLEALPVLPLLTGKLEQLRLTLTGYGLMPSSLPSMNAQLRSQQAVNFYPADISTREQFHPQGIVSEASYDVNFKANQQGFHDLGSVTLNYFDPDTGTIESLVSPVGHISSIHFWLLLLIGLVVLVISVYLISSMYHWIKHKWYTRHCYLQAQQLLQTARSARELKKVLDWIARAENWPANQTLRQWFGNYLGIDNKLSLTSLEQLERQLYKGETTDLEPVKRQLKEACQHGWI